MSKAISADKFLFQEMNQDIKRARLWGISFIITGLLIQSFHFILSLISGFRFMLILTGIIFVIIGVLFIMGTTSVPKTRNDILRRLLLVMQERNPKRRLWAAQRLVGYLKDGNFSKEEILDTTSTLVNHALHPDVPNRFVSYVAVDHIIVLREIAVTVPMNKHTRKEFVSMIRVLKKIPNLPEDAENILLDAITFSPNKLPVQAYNDLLNEKDK